MPGKPTLACQRAGHSMTPQRAAGVTLATALTAIFAAAVACCAPPAQSAPAAFNLASPDLASGRFDSRFMLSSFGCHGGNLSPALAWSHAPAGTRRFAIQMIDLDAPNGGFWHWAVYDLPATATGLPRGAANLVSHLPAPAYGGNTDFRDTGAAGWDGGYAGPCPPRGDAPHRYRITIYAYAADRLAEAGGIPRTGSAALYAFVLDRGLGERLLGKASITAAAAR